MSNPEYEIVLNSYEVKDFGLKDGNPVHHEIAVKLDGQPVMALNGNPHARETGEMKQISLHGRDTLRVSVTDRTYEDLSAMDKVSEISLYKTHDPHDAAEKIVRGMEAADYINQNNVDYVIMDLEQPGQNSNSAARTIVHGMGLDYPEEAKELWAPGDERILLPENHQSRLDHRDVQPTDISDLHDRLEVEQVKADVKADPNPYENISPTRRMGRDIHREKTGQYFNPDKAEAEKAEQQAQQNMSPEYEAAQPVPHETSQPSLATPGA